MIQNLSQGAGQVADLLKNTPGTDSNAATELDSNTGEAGGARETLVRHPHLLGFSGLYRGDVIPLIGSRFVIGRSEECDFAIPQDDQLSPRHLRLFTRDGNWFCLDLKSAKGTFVDGVRLGGEAVLVPSGGLVRLGGQEFQVLYGDAAVAEPTNAAKPATRTIEPPSVTTPRTRTIEPPARPEPIAMATPITPVPAAAGWTPVKTAPPARATAAALAAATRQSLAGSKQDTDEPSYEIIQTLAELIETVFGDARRPVARRGRAATAVKSKARWIPHGEAITVGDIVLPDGMIYFGSGLRSLNGYDTEPALIDPRLKVSDFPERSNFDGSHFDLSYASLSPTARRRYLLWLAEGRHDSAVDVRFPLLFFYGLERRLVASLLYGAPKGARSEPPPTPAETEALRRELDRMLRAAHSPEFASLVRDLLQFVDLKRLIDSGSQNALPDPDLLLDSPKRGQELPPLLAFALAQIAATKRPIPADWAWAWYLHDPESTVRAATTRCPDETRRMFALRFAELAGNGGTRLRLLKAPLSFHYTLANPDCYAEAVLSRHTTDDFPKSLRRVSRTPLGAIRTAAEAAIRAVDPYSRRIRRDMELRHTLATCALLPDPLFEEHPSVQRFRAYLDTFDRPNTEPVASVSTKALLSEWQRLDPPDRNAVAPEFPSDVALSRGETISFLDSMDRLGFVVEPDLRFGGGPMTMGNTGDATSMIARRIGDSRPTAPLVTVVGLPLLVRAALGGGGSVDHTSLMRLAGALPAAKTSDPTRTRVRIAYLTANPREAVKLPKRSEPALMEATLGEKSQIADVLAATVSSGGAVSPAAVAELIKLFKVLGLPDSEVYARLHASAATHAVASAGRSGRKAAVVESDEPLATIRDGQPGEAYALPKPPRSSAARRKRGVTIDQALVREKMAESAQIGSLLADIFADESAESPNPATPDNSARIASPLAAAPAPAGKLDDRHSALLRTLCGRESWSLAAVAALARTASVMPNAAIDAINEAAFERFEEPVLEGEDPIYVMQDLARELLAEEKY